VRVAQEQDQPEVLEPLLEELGLQTPEAVAVAVDLVELLDLERLEL
jgi:hypothetical protein